MYVVSFLFCSMSTKQVSSCRLVPCFLSLLFSVFSLVLSNVILRKYVCACEQFFFIYLSLFLFCGSSSLFFYLEKNLQPFNVDIIVVANFAFSFPFFFNILQKHENSRLFYRNRNEPCSTIPFLSLVLLST